MNNVGTTGHKEDHVWKNKEPALEGAVDIYSRRE